MGAKAYDEDYDDDFMLQVDAAEAAALQLSRKRGVDEVGSLEHRRGQSQVERLSHPEAVMMSASTPFADTTSQQSGSPAMSARQDLSMETCHQQGALQRYRWKVDSILIQDNGDGSSNAGAEERIGKGELTVNCTEGSGSSLMVVNVVVTAAEGDGNAMEIPLHGINHFFATGTSNIFDEGTSTSLGPEPSFETRESATPSPQPLLVLGLEIGCSILMSGLTLQGEPRISHPAGRSSSSEALVQDATLTATTGSGLTHGKMLFPSPPILPTATPERRRLALTEFPSLWSAGQQLSGGETREIADPVLARLVRGFSGVAKNVAVVCSSTSIAAAPVPDSSSSSSGNKGGTFVSISGPLPSTTDPMTSIEASSLGRSQGGHPGDLAASSSIPELGASAAASGKAVGDNGGTTVITSLSASVVNSSALQAQQAATMPRETRRTGNSGLAHASKELVGDSDEKAAPPKNKAEESIDVPDEEWRRPLAAAPPDRRRSAARRKMPRLRDGSRKRAGRPVVLHLHDDDNPGGAHRQGEGMIGDMVPQASSFKRAGVQGGGGIDSGDACRREGYSEKRSLSVEDSGHQSMEGGISKVGRFTPPLPPRRSLQAKGESSWLALRKALHERYRDCEERGVAEQAAAKALGRGRGRGGGPRLNEENDSSAGERMSPGLRIFRRQEHAFTYADALRERLALEEAVRYKVLSFETSATGRRKFLVCDIRRFEEHYPYTALPDPSLPRRLQPPPVQPCIREPPPRPQPLIQDEEQVCSRTGKPPCPAGITKTLPLASRLCSEFLEKQQQEQRQQRQHHQQHSCDLQHRRDGQHGVALGPGQAGDSGASLARPSFVRSGYTPSSSASSALIPSAPAKPPLRHVYEIIRDGCPCRMYFDLEFARGPNPGLDGEELVLAWINVVAGKLHQDFGLSVGKSNFLDLDSSTPKKFSRHLILHLPGDQLFQDNSHIGRFVNSLAADLETWRPPQSQPQPHLDPLPFGGGGGSSGSSSSNTQGGGNELTLALSPGRKCTSVPPAASDTFLDSSAAPTDVPTVTAASPKVMLEDFDDGGSGSAGALERLWVKDGDGRSVLFADVSVYTRNRCFRLLGSSKFGKSAALQVAATNCRTLDCMIWRGKGGVVASPSSSRELHQQQLRDVARTLLHDSLVVPAGQRPAKESFLTVAGFGGGAAGQHRLYSRFGASCKSQTHSRERQQQQGDVPATVSSADWGGQYRCGPEGSEHVGGGKRSGCPRDSLSGHGRVQGQLGDGGWSVSSQGFGPSPFPAIDAFLRTLVCQGGTTGQLRQWSYSAGQFPPGNRDHLGGIDENSKSLGGGAEKAESAGSEGASRAPTIRKLTHQVANNRWCWNIGRAHKSNHVFLVTDLSRGEVRQHCHDQECRRSGYRSNPVRLPSEVAPSEDDVESFELDLGLAAAVRESPTDWAAIA